MTFLNFGINSKLSVSQIYMELGFLFFYFFSSGGGEVGYVLIIISKLLLTYHQCSVFMWNLMILVL